MIGTLDCSPNFARVSPKRFLTRKKELQGGYRSPHLPCTQPCRCRLFQRCVIPPLCAPRYLNDFIKPHIKFSQGIPIGIQRHRPDAWRTKMSRAPAAADAAAHHNSRLIESPGCLADSIHGIMTLRPEASNKAVRLLSVRLSGNAVDLPLAEAPHTGLLS